MSEDREPEWIVYYSDGVDADGNVTNVNDFKITATSGIPGGVRAVKVPFSELAMPDDAPVFRVPDKDDAA